MNMPASMHACVGASAYLLLDLELDDGHQIDVSHDPGPGVHEHGVPGDPGEQLLDESVFLS